MKKHFQDYYETSIMTINGSPPAETRYFNLESGVIPDHDKKADDASDDSSSDDDTDTLQQLIIYWQYRKSFESHLQDEATAGPEVISAYNLPRIERIEPITETTLNISSTSAGNFLSNSSTAAAARSTEKSAAGPTSAATRKSRKLAATLRSVEDWRELLRRSNMIVVFEKSALKSRRVPSIVVDDLSLTVSSGKLVVDATNMKTPIQNSWGGMRRLHLIPRNDIHLIKGVMREFSTYWKRI
ncbi:hypothetical protein PSPO01_08883 [Paraphaeosphaeria sporulosa]